MAKKLRTGETTNLGFIRAMAERNVEVRPEHPAEELRDDFDALDSSKKVTFFSTNETVLNTVNNATPGPVVETANITFIFKDAETEQAVPDCHLIIKNRETDETILDTVMIGDSITVPLYKGIGILFLVEKEGYQSASWSADVTDDETFINQISVLETNVELRFVDSATGERVVASRFLLIDSNTGSIVVEAFDSDGFAGPLKANRSYELRFESENYYLDPFSIFVGIEAIDLNITVQLIPDTATVIIDSFINNITEERVEAESLTITDKDTGEEVWRGELVSSLNVSLPTRHSYYLVADFGNFHNLFFELTNFIGAYFGDLRVVPSKTTLHISYKNAETGEPETATKVAVKYTDTDEVIDTFELVGDVDVYGVDTRREISVTTNFAIYQDTYNTFYSSEGEELFCNNVINPGDRLPDTTCTFLFDDGETSTSASGSLRVLYKSVEYTSRSFEDSESVSLELPETKTFDVVFSFPARPDTTLSVTPHLEEPNEFGVTVPDEVTNVDLTLYTYLDGEPTEMESVMLIVDGEWDWSGDLVPFGTVVSGVPAGRVLQYTISVGGFSLSGNYYIGYDAEQQLNVNFETPEPTELEVNFNIIDEAGTFDVNGAKIEIENQATHHTSTFTNTTYCRMQVEENVSYNIRFMNPTTGWTSNDVDNITPNQLNSFTFDIHSRAVKTVYFNFCEDGGEYRGPLNFRVSRTYADEERFTEVGGLVAVKVTSGLSSEINWGDENFRNDSRYLSYETYGDGETVSLDLRRQGTNTIEVNFTVDETDAEYSNVDTVLLLSVPSQDYEYTEWGLENNQPLTIERVPDGAYSLNISGINITGFNRSGNISGGEVVTIDANVVALEPKDVVVNFVNGTTGEYIDPQQLGWYEAYVEGPGMFEPHWLDIDDEGVASFTAYGDSSYTVHFDSEEFATYSQGDFNGNNSEWHIYLTPVEPPRPYQSMTARFYDNEDYDFYTNGAVIKAEALLPEGEVLLGTANNRDFLTVDTTAIDEGVTIRFSINSPVYGADSWEEVVPENYDGGDHGFEYRLTRGQCTLELVFRNANTGEAIDSVIAVIEDGIYVYSDGRIENHGTVSGVRKGIECNFDLTAVGYERDQTTIVVGTDDYSVITFDLIPGQPGEDTVTIEFLDSEYSTTNTSDMTMSVYTNDDDTQLIYLEGTNRCILENMAIYDGRDFRVELKSPIYGNHTEIFTVSSDNLPQYFSYELNRERMNMAFHFSINGNPIEGADHITITDDELNQVVATLDNPTSGVAYDLKKGTRHYVEAALEGHTSVGTTFMTVFEDSSMAIDFWEEEPSMIKGAGFRFYNSVTGEELWEDVAVNYAIYNAGGELIEDGSTSWAVDLGENTLETNDEDADYAEVTFNVNGYDSYSKTYTLREEPYTSYDVFLSPQHSPVGGINITVEPQSPEGTEFDGSRGLIEIINNTTGETVSSTMSNQIEIELPIGNYTIEYENPTSSTISEEFSVEEGVVYDATYFTNPLSAKHIHFTVCDSITKDPLNDYSISINQEKAHDTQVLGPSDTPEFTIFEGRSTTVEGTAPKYVNNSWTYDYDSYSDGAEIDYDMTPHSRKGVIIDFVDDTTGDPISNDWSINYRFKDSFNDAYTEWYSIDFQEADLPVTLSVDNLGVDKIELNANMYGYVSVVGLLYDLGLNTSGGYRSYTIGLSPEEPEPDYVFNDEDRCIETGVVMQEGNTYRVEVQFMPTSLDYEPSSEAWVFSAYDEMDCFRLGCVGELPNHWAVDGGNLISYSPEGTDIDVVYTYELSYTSPVNFSATSPITLFSQSEQGNHPYPDRYFKGKIYYCKIWENDVLIRDFTADGDGFTDQVTGNYFTWYEEPVEERWGSQFTFTDGGTGDSIESMVTLSYRFLDGEGNEIQSDSYGHDLSTGPVTLDTDNPEVAEAYVSFSIDGYETTEEMQSALDPQPYPVVNIVLEPNAPVQYAIGVSAVNGEGVKYEGQSVRFTLDGRLAGESTFSELEEAESESGDYVFINDVGTYDEYEALRVSARLVGTNMEGHSAELTPGSDTDVSITLDYKGAAITVLDSSSGDELSNIDEVMYTFFDNSGNEVDSGTLSVVSSPFDVETDYSIASTLSLTINLAGYVEETSDCGVDFRPNYTSNTIELSPEPPRGFTLNVEDLMSGGPANDFSIITTFFDEEGNDVYNFGEEGSSPYSLTTDNPDAVRATAVITKEGYQDCEVSIDNLDVEPYPEYSAILDQLMFNLDVAASKDGDFDPEALYFRFEGYNTVIEDWETLYEANPGVNHFTIEDLGWFDNPDCSKYRFFVNDGESCGFSGEIPREEMSSRSIVVELTQSPDVDISENVSLNINIESASLDNTPTITYNLESKQTYFNFDVAGPEGLGVTYEYTLTNGDPGSIENEDYISGGTVHCEYSVDGEIASLTVTPLDQFRFRYSVDSGLTPIGVIELLEPDDFRAIKGYIGNFAEDTQFAVVIGDDNRIRSFDIDLVEGSDRLKFHDINSGDNYIAYITTDSETGNESVVAIVEPEDESPIIGE